MYKLPNPKKEQNILKPCLLSCPFSWGIRRFRCIIPAGCRMGSAPRILVIHLGGFEI